MTISIFPGSFDPITNGHLDVIRKAESMFDMVYVVIMTNTHKNYLFSPTKRLELAQAALQGMPNVKVVMRPNSLTVNVAQELKARAIVRGVRNTADFLYEQQIAGLNEKIAPNIHTVLIFTDPQNSFVASSMIKEVAKFGGKVEQFLPEEAAKALEKKMKYNEKE